MNIAEEFAKHNPNVTEEELEIAIKQSMSYYRCALMEVETKFKVLSENFSILSDRNPIESIQTRMKDEDSIINKLIRRNLELSVESMEKNLFDIAGVRIICSFENDIYNLAHLFLKQDDVRLIEKKDYIQHAKPNGYRSLHLIIEIPIFLANEKKWVKVEVQFRTIAMDFWASLEHKIRYKKDLPQERLNEIDDELYICSKICQQLDHKMQEKKDGE